MEPIALHNEGEIIGVHGVDVTVGGVVQQQGDARQTRYVVMPDGSLSALSDFTYGLYIIGKPERLTQPRTLSATDFQYFSNSATSVIPDTAGRRTRFGARQVIGVRRISVAFLR